MPLANIMGLFRFNKKNDVLDLTERYRKQQEKAVQMKGELQQTSSSQESSTSNAFSIFGGSVPSANTSTDSSPEDTSSIHERKRKLTKRLLDMTTKIEELSNQIYHVQQRIEVLERKMDVNRF